MLLNWTLGDNDKRSHDQATELLRSLRGRNATVPVFLMADRRVAAITVEVATLADEFVWLLEDTASFIAGRVSASIERYIEALLPPFAAALARYNRDREYSWAAPGHQGGVAFLKSPVGRVFFDFYGENLFRTDMGIERGALGSLLGHSGPIGESERYAARVFGAHRSYSVLNGTSGSNRAIMSACVGDAEIALCDRNCHKSIEQGLVLTGGIPVFLNPTRNRYGIIGPIPPGQLEPKAIAKAIAANPLAKTARASGRSTRWSRTAPMTACATTPRRPRRGWRRAWTESTSTRRGTATRGSIRCIATVTPCGANPADHPKDGPTVFATHSTHKLLAALSQTSYIHIRDGRGAIDHGRFNEAYCSQASTSPLYALIASNDVAAAMMDGPGGPALTQEVIDEAVACRLAVARVRQEFLAKKDWFFAPWNAEEVRDPKTGKRIPFHDASAELLATDPGLLGAASGRELARLRGHPRQLVHARPDQVRHRVPGHEAGRTARQEWHSRGHRHRLSRSPRDRAFAHDRPHGAVPVLRGHHQGQVGDAAQCAAGLQDRLRPQRAPRRRCFPASWPPHPTATRGWGSRIWATRCGRT